MWLRTPCAVFLSAACALIGTAAYAGRAPLRALSTTAPEVIAMLEAERAWIAQDPAMGAGVGLTPLIVKRNDKYAYLTAKVSGAANVPFIEAVLELKGGRWISTGYMPSPTPPRASIRDICRYGDGVHREVFSECK